MKASILLYKDIGKKTSTILPETLILFWRVLQQNEMKKDTLMQYKRLKNQIFGERPPFL